MIARLLAAMSSCSLAAAPAAAQSRAEIERTMRRATTFMVERVATNGGYVWSYLPDMSRRWGEIEARPSMIWVQPPGTATMGHLFLDAYHATGDDYYYRAAERAAGALIAGQHRSGGWNYFIDFAGPDSTRRMVPRRSAATPGGWRNSSIMPTMRPSTMPARRRRCSSCCASISRSATGNIARRSIGRSTSSSTANIRTAAGRSAGRTSAIIPLMRATSPSTTTSRAENVRFLLMVYRSLGEERVRPAILRAMEIFLATHQPMPQPGWSLQQRLDLKPAGARSYEPLSLATHTTAANVRQLMNFYRMTGDARFLARVPEALDWLESLRLPPDPARRGRDFPTFIELGTNRPLYVHRRGSNVVNGALLLGLQPGRRRSAITAPSAPSTSRRCGGTMPSCAPRRARSCCATRRSARRAMRRCRAP